MPVKSEQPLRRRAGPGRGRAADGGGEELQESISWIKRRGS
jgi:hypothetical protein